MRIGWLAICATVMWILSFWGATAQDVTLKSRDSDVEINGNLLGFDGEFYRVDTVYGELTVDGSGVLCEGPGCPDLENFVTRVLFSGAPSIGRVLMPALIEAFAIRGNYSLKRINSAKDRFTYKIFDDETLLGEFTFHLTNTDEGFADLLADQADVAMSVREIRKDEKTRGREAGIGDLTGRGRSQIVALDALVPVVSPSNPVQSITLPQIAQVMSGAIDNWQELGGPNAPIDVHVMSQSSGLGQAATDRLLAPVDRKLVENAILHDTPKDLADAVAKDPFAIGVTSRSETENTWVLSLKGACGFDLNATRRAVKTEDYPLTAPLFLYLPARRFPKLQREFLAYLRDPSAQLVIRRAGFVDQSPEEIPIDQQGNRFANAIAHAGAETSLSELKRMVNTLSPLRRLSTTFRFESGSTRLDAQSRSNIQQLARALEIGLYDTRKLVFAGFSDGDGTAEDNRNISERRARAILSAVQTAAETADFTRITMETAAFGEAMPMACDDSEWGRNTNRRVEVWVR